MQTLTPSASCRYTPQLAARIVPTLLLAAVGGAQAQLSPSGPPMPLNEMACLVRPTGSWTNASEGPGGQMQLLAPKVLAQGRAKALPSSQPNRRAVRFTYRFPDLNQLLKDLQPESRRRFAAQSAKATVHRSGPNNATPEAKKSANFSGHQSAIGQTGTVRERAPFGSSLWTRIDVRGLESGASQPTKHFMLTIECEMKIEP